MMGWNAKWEARYERERGRERERERERKVIRQIVVSDMKIIWNFPAFNARASWL